MQIKDIDTAKVYAYREGSYGYARPVRVLDTTQAYQHAGNSTYIPLPAGSRTRRGYAGSRRLAGGYLAVTRSYGDVSPDRMEQLRAVTLEQATRNSLPEGISVTLLTTARWVMDEEYEAREARLAEEKKAKVAWKKEEAARAAETTAVASELREAMQAIGFSFPAGYGGGLRISSDRDNVELRMPKDEASELARVLRRYKEL